MVLRMRLRRAFRRMIKRRVGKRRWKGIKKRSLGLTRRAVLRGTVKKQWFIANKLWNSPSVATDESS